MPARQCHFMASLDAGAVAGGLPSETDPLASRLLDVIAKGQCYGGFTPSQSSLLSGSIHFEVRGTRVREEDMMSLPRS
jgi:hypothetical protein